MGRPLKRSLTLRGHATSVSIEPEFWRAFRRIAAARGQALNALAAEIDAARPAGTGLATAIRLHVLADLERRLAALEPAAGTVAAGEGRGAGAAAQAALRRGGIE